MADEPNPFEEMAVSFFGEAAKYIKDTMDEIKNAGSGDNSGGTPPPPPPKTDPPKVDPPKTDPPAKRKHSWFGEID